MLSVELFKPHNKQKEVLKACLDKRGSFFVTVVAGRQGGKTMLAENIAIYWALNNNKVKVWFVSPTEGQSRRIYREILNAVIPTNLVKTHKESAGGIEIQFITGSIIEFKSAASEDSLRGTAVDYLIIDEAAFIKQRTYEEVLLPTLNVKGKKCLLISTPKGKNYLYDNYLRGLKEDEPSFASFKFTSEDNPVANKELIETFRRTMHERLFAQEFLAEFVDSSAVFNNISELIKTPTHSQKYFVGIDIGMEHDYTVVTVLNQAGEMVYVDRFTKIKSPDMKKRIMATISKFNPVATYIEKNNQGLPIYQDLLHEHRVPNLVGWDTTPASKEEIVFQLVDAFNEKKLSILNDQQLIEELNAFVFEFSKTGKIKFSAAAGFHDDMVMSLAIAYECLIKNKNKGSDFKSSYDFAFA